MKYYYRRLGGALGVRIQEIWPRACDNGKINIVANQPAEMLRNKPERDRNHARESENFIHFYHTSSLDRAQEKWDKRGNVSYLIVEKNTLFISVFSWYQTRTLRRLNSPIAGERLDDQR